MLSYETYVQQQDAMSMERFIHRVYFSCDSLAAARRQLGITQSELAQRTGIAQGAISRIESGKANPSIKTLTRLADGLGMNVALGFVPRSDLGALK